MGRVGGHPWAAFSPSGLPPCRIRAAGSATGPCFPVSSSSWGSDGGKRGMAPRAWSTTAGLWDDSPRREGDQEFHLHLERDCLLVSKGGNLIPHKSNKSKGHLSPQSDVWMETWIWVPDFLSLLNWCTIEQVTSSPIWLGMSSQQLC